MSFFLQCLLVICSCVYAQEAFQSLNNLTNDGIVRVASMPFYAWTENNNNVSLHVLEGKYILGNGVLYEFAINVNQSHPIRFSGKMNVRILYKVSGEFVTQTCFHGMQNWLMVSPNGRTGCQTTKQHEKYGTAFDAQKVKSEEQDIVSTFTNAANSKMIGFLVAGAIASVLAILVAVAVLIRMNKKLAIDEECASPKSDKGLMESRNASPVAEDMIATV